MTVVHPIRAAWLTKGDTGAQNYDEFADETEITSIIEANPRSALAVEMPHFAPESLGKSFVESLPAARARLDAAFADGFYQQHENVLVLYRITRGHSVSYGLWCMVDTDQISTSADEPGLVIRNEDVFPEKVRERVMLAETLGHLLSPVLLLQTARGDELHASLAAACAAAGPAFSSDLAGTHEVWPLDGSSSLALELIGLAGGGELVVADGNHRSLAAQTGGLPRFLAVVTTPASVEIAPYNRLVRDVPGPLPLEPGDTVRVYTREGGMRSIGLPQDPTLGLVDNLDHALVERVLLGQTLGLEPGDKRITYVGGDYPESWLIGEVDAGRADLAVLIDPVTVPDFIEVNLARRKMPRKSTWFVPKARAGLVVAESEESQAGCHRPDPPSDTSPSAQL